MPASHWVQLVQQAHQHRFGFLFRRQHLLQIRLGRDQLGLFGLLRGAEFIQRGLHLSGRSIVIQSLLQRFAIRISLSAAETTTAAAATATASATTATAKAAEIHRITASIHHLLDQRLNRAPFGIIRETKAFLGPIHHLLLELGRIKISTATATATTITTATTTATAVILG